MTTQTLFRSLGAVSTAGQTWSLSRLLRVDPLLFLGLLALCGYGLVVLYSASGDSVFEVRRQALAMGLAFLGMLVVAQFDIHFYRRFAPSLYSLGLVLLGGVLVFGVEVNGARSWLNLPGLPRFQPSEIMKIMVPMLLAWFFGSRPLPPRFIHLFWAGVLLVLPAGLIVAQNDTGTALMVGMSGVFVILLAGVPWKLVLSGGFALLAASPAWYIFLAKAHQKNRILTFFDPYRDPTGAGYNIIQSQIAIGSGGLQGKGWQNGAQSQLDFIPESNTDFILAVLAEEFGLVGVAFLIVLYLLVLSRGFVIALNARDTFSRLLAGGITLTFFFYVFVNMAMVTGLMPVIGLPLPLVSRGGTSIISLFVAFGLLMSIQAGSRTLYR